MPKSEQLRKQARRKQRPPPPRPARNELDEVASPASSLAFEGVEEMSASKRPLYPIFEASDDAGEDDAVEDVAQHVEKKRRLGVEQVKSLEKYFELENKLEPERKLQLARELGLQPRQVAVWFQNRRARWKTKQLEKDYDALKVNLDTLKSDYSTLLQEKLKLEAEVQRLNQALKNPKIIRPGSDEKVVLASNLEVKLEDESELCNKEDELPTTTKSSKTGNKNTTVNLLSSPPCKKDCSSSDSDDSEILDEESTPLQQQLNQQNVTRNNIAKPVVSNSIQNQAQAQLEHHHQQQQQQQQPQQQVMLDMDPLLADDDDSYVRLFQEGYTRVPKLEDGSSFQYHDVGSGGFIGLEDQDQGWWEWT